MTVKTAATATANQKNNMANMGVDELLGELEELNFDLAANWDKYTLNDLEGLAAAAEALDERILQMESPAVIEVLSSRAQRNCSGGCR